MNFVFNETTRPREVLNLWQRPRTELKEGKTTIGRHLENHCMAPFKNSLDKFHWHACILQLLEGKS